MRKTTLSKEAVANKKAVDTAGLQSALGCGRKTALSIGNAAKARCQIGKRVLWNMNKIQKYLDSISE